MSDRPTPRTDAEALWPASNDGSDTYEPGGAYVTSDFARELERESDARAERIAELEADLGETAAMRDAACAICSDVRAENAKLREELDEAKADKHRMDWMETECHDLVRNYRDDPGVVQSSDGMQFYGETLREAIDKSLAGKEPS